MIAANRISFSETASGHLSAVLERKGKEKPLHSRRDPLKEAERFILRTADNWKQTPAAIIVLGSGLGYIERVLGSRYPSTVLLSIKLTLRLREQGVNLSNPCWAPDAAGTLRAFIFENLNSLDMDGLQIVTWPPALQAAPEVMAPLRDELLRILDQLKGNMATTAGFGRRWFRNAVYNFRHTVPDRAVQGLQGPCVITASGWSLPESLSTLKKSRRDFSLLALPSSLPALEEADIIPDFIITTDPGYYARSHLRYYSEEGVPIIYSLNSARGIDRWQGPRILFSESTWLEEQLLDDLALPDRDRLQVNGTVAGSALLWLLSRSSGGAIIFAGLDLCSRDLQSHCRPHSFEPLHLSRIRRTFPLTALYHSRQGKSRRLGEGPCLIAPALKTYTGWFSDLPPAAAARLGRLNPSPVPLGTMTELDGPAFRAWLRQGPKPIRKTVYPQGYPAEGKRERKLIETAERFAEALEDFSALCRRQGLQRALRNNHTGKKLLMHTDLPNLLALNRQQRRTGENGSLEDLISTGKADIRYWMAKDKG